MKCLIFVSMETLCISPCWLWHFFCFLWRIDLYEHPATTQPLRITIITDGSLPPMNATICQNYGFHLLCWGCLRVKELKVSKVLSRTLIMCEVLACLHMHSLSPFPFSCVEAEYNKALVVWACSPECPLSLTLTLFPFISSPSSSFEKLPPEWLVRAQREVLLCNGWRIVLRCCVHMCLLLGGERSIGCQHSVVALAQTLQLVYVFYVAL